jgi:hypothetical protein
MLSFLMLDEKCINILPRQLSVIDLFTTNSSIGKMFFHFRIISLITLQVQSNFIRSLSDNRELKKNSEEIFLSTILSNGEPFLLLHILISADTVYGYKQSTCI